jgi:hypothetical protein
MLIFLWYLHTIELLKYLIIIELPTSLIPSLDKPNTFHGGQTSSTPDTGVSIVHLKVVVKDTPIMH